MLAVEHYRADPELSMERCRLEGRRKVLQVSLQAETIYL